MPPSKGKPGEVKPTSKDQYTKTNQKGKGKGGSDGRGKLSK